MENLNDIVFYSLDKAIRGYRQYAQKQIEAAGFKITIDQWLVLKAIEEDSEAKQQQIAARVFKDVASVTRIIENLVQKGYLERSFHSTDRRRFRLQLTQKGVSLIEEIKPYTDNNRRKALEGLSSKNIRTLQETLLTIINNVTDN